MKLHRDLEITQKSAWHLAHQIRARFSNDLEQLSEPVEVDETFIGRKEKKKHEDKRNHARGTSGKSVVVCMKDREANKPVPERTKEEIHGLIGGNVSQAKVYTDNHKSYLGLPYNHET